VNFQIIQSSDLDDILQFEQNLLAQLIPDEMERTMHSWHSRWRKESLEHYLPMGWSFLARDENNKLIGYFLGQPLLFFDGFTQSLWVEHVQAVNNSVRDQLCEIAYKLSKEKHFQKVYFPKGIELSYSEAWQPGVRSAWTAKVTR
jgi:hypothetical protein